MIVIVDYGMGNVGSIVNMLKKVGAVAIISADPGDIMTADKLILPGVGSFDQGMTNLAERGLIEVLNKRVLEEKCNILGICLGMQLLCEKSEEGNAKCLGIIPCDAIKFQGNIKIPHMGWNSIQIKSKSKLMEGIDSESYFYFAHSYYVPLNEYTTVTVDYSTQISAVVQKDNYFGVQFHPEKSGENGIKLIKNFIELC